MKLNFYATFLCAGLFAASASGAGAFCAPAPSAMTSASLPNGMTNPQLLALRDQLSNVVLAKYPDAEIEFLGDALVIRNRSAKFETHLFTPFDDTFPTDGIQFPANYDEFVIRISLENGTVASRLPQGTQKRPFGNFSSNVLRTKIANEENNPSFFSDVPLTSWPIPTLYRLVQAGAIEKLYSPAGSVLNGERSFTGYEMTVLVARALYIESNQQKLIAATQDSKEDFANLRMAFPPEKLDTNGIAVRQSLSQNKVLWLAFAYGKGVDASFVADVKQTVADYAAKNLPAN